MSSIADRRPPGKMPESDRFTRGILDAAAQIRDGEPLDNQRLLFIASTALEKFGGGRRPAPTVRGRLETLLPDCDVLVIRCPKCGSESRHLWSRDLPADQPRKRMAHCGCYEFGYLAVPMRETTQ